MYVHQCRRTCDDGKPISIFVNHRELKGRENWPSEGVVTKAIGGWEMTTIPGPVVRHKGKLQESQGTLHFYMTGMKVVLCHRHGSLAGPLSCRVKRHVDVNTLCITAEIGCRYGYCRGDEARRKKGLVKTVIPMVCCYKRDAACIKHRLTKWVRMGGRPSLANPKNWAALSTGEALAV